MRVTARVVITVAACITSAFSLGCQADLNARSSPLISGEDQAGQAIVFGRYAGVYRLGTSGEVHAFDLYAENCGEQVTGVLFAPTGEEVALQGARTGSAVTFDFDAPAFAGSLTGIIQTVRVLSGTWASDDGQGGTWVATYVDGSVKDYPCSVAEDYLGALD
jgi:hypothetical protein